MPRGIPSWPSLFIWFFIEFSSILQAFEPSKSWFFLRKNKVFFFKKWLFKVSIDFSSILLPTCLHFPFQNPSKFHQKSILAGIDFLIDFCSDFFSIFARFWSPTWIHVGLKNRSGANQNAFQVGLESHKPPWPPPGLDFHRFLIDFWRILEGFLMDFSKIFDRIVIDFLRIFFKDFWCIFDRFLRDRCTSDHSASLQCATRHGCSSSIRRRNVGLHSKRSRRHAAETTCDASTNRLSAQARWRLRSFAALWIILSGIRPIL